MIIRVGLGSRKGINISISRKGPRQRKAERVLESSKVTVRSYDLKRASQEPLAAATSERYYETHWNPVGINICIKTGRKRTFRFLTTARAKNALLKEKNV